jgi:hypothetical protein
MEQRFPIGLDDFRELRELGLEYIDKSHLISELLDDVGAKVTLLPRPRRFGKTLNLSMLRCFFEKRDEDLSHLFEGLSIAAAGDEYHRHFQRYPVIHMTLKDIKADTWELAWEGLRLKIEALFDEHRYLLDDGRVSEREARNYRAILDGSAERGLYHRALLDLSGLLERHHGAPVVILLDEYDQPIHAAYIHGYDTQALSFFRAFLTEGLKGNPHLFKGVLTGILRIARESIFSGLNNLAVYSLLRPEMSTCFGFTEPEVERLLERAGVADKIEDVRRWYNGYLFGNTVVYNPWSILNYAASRDKLLRNYWVTTSSNDLVREMLERHALAIQPAITALLEGGSIERKVDENVVLADLETDEEALFNLLVFAGYLRAARVVDDPRDDIYYRLSIPNREVRDVYATTFQRWMRRRLGGGESGVERLKKALFEGDAETLQEQLQAFTMNMLSYHDVKAKEAEAGAGPVSPRLRTEQVVHAFVIGLLATLPSEFEVRSNRESGLGRPDVMIRPRRPGNPGVVLELKIIKAGVKAPEAALREGLAQIRKNAYLAELTAAGASPAHAFVAAFDGKRVWVRSAGEAGEAAKKARKRAPEPQKARPAAKAPRTSKRKR